MQRSSNLNGIPYLLTKLIVFENNTHCGPQQKEEGSLIPYKQELIGRINLVNPICFLKQSRHTLWPLLI